jgi:hypothetical protein
MMTEGFLAGFVFVYHIFQFSGAKFSLFMIVAIVPILKFIEVRLLELWFHDWSDFKEEVKLFYEILSVLILRFIGVIDDDVVEPAISGTGKELFNVKILDFEVEFTADGCGLEFLASFHL